jgi:polynucleotide 5'-kinase involved in rRNA processing
MMLLLFFMRLIYTSSSNDSGLNFIVTIEGSGAQKDLVEFIRDGKINIELLKKRAVMVLGLTGTGKSTLVNYLNNVLLVCKRLSGK